MYSTKKEKFSYSKINTYISCPFKYWLVYVKGNFIDSDSIAPAFGTLVHWIEQQIAISIIAGKSIDYEQLKRDFLEINIPKKNKYDTNGGIYGINILKEKYKKEFYETDEEGNSFFTKAIDYQTQGIYRLEEYLKANPNLEIVDTEKHFEVEFEGVVLSGSIDRVLRDKNTGEYIIEDIKTKNKPFKEQDTITPLQGAIYSYALKELYNLQEYPEHFFYDLPFCDIKQSAGVPGFVKTGMKKIKKVLEEIKMLNFKSNPTPLCHWCNFCETNESQPQEAKGLCPYYSLWTRENRTKECAHQWEGMERHEAVVQEFFSREVTPEYDFEF